MSDIQPEPPKQGWTLRIHTGQDLVEIASRDKRVEMTKHQALALAEKIQFHLQKQIIEAKHD